MRRPPHHRRGKFKLRHPAQEAPSALQEPGGEAPMHAQERAHGPQRAQGPVEPNMSLMTNTEECTFMQAVREAPTAQEAVELWNPKVKTTPAK